MINKEEILRKESENDGQSIYLFRDEMIGMYVAYGLSAYYTTMVVEPYTSFSEELQMPLVLLKHEHILYLRQSLVKLEHIRGTYYHFLLREPIGDAGYQRWLEKVKE